MLLIYCTGVDDFDAGPHIVEFPINTTMVLFNISVTVEGILEPDETFMLSIDPTQLISQVILGNVSQASALIIDDDRKCNSYCNIVTYGNFTESTIAWKIVFNERSVYLICYLNIYHFAWKDQS